VCVALASLRYHLEPETLILPFNAWNRMSRRMSIAPWIWRVFGVVVVLASGGGVACAYNAGIQRTTQLAHGGHWQSMSAAADGGEATPIASALHPSAVVREQSAVEFVLDAPPDVAIQLFGPAREARWDLTWNPEFVDPADSISMTAGAVFLIRKDGRESVWVLHTYDTVHRKIEYIRVTPGHLVAEMWVSVAPTAGGKALTTVAYRYTGLSEEGSSFIRMWARKFPTTGPHWAKVINTYLATGKPHTG
jgi:hypothetical protein